MKFARNAAAAIAVTGLLIGAIFVMFPAEAEAAKIFTGSGTVAAGSNPGQDAIISGVAVVAIPALSFVPADDVTIRIGNSATLTNNVLSDTVCTATGTLNGETLVSGQTKVNTGFSGATLKNANFAGTGYVAAGSAGSFTLQAGANAFVGTTGSGFGYKDEVNPDDVFVHVSYSLTMIKNGACWNSYADIAKYDADKLRTIWVQVAIEQGGASTWFMSSIPAPITVKLVGTAETTIAPDTVPGNIKGRVDSTPASENGGSATARILFGSDQANKDSIGTNVKVTIDPSLLTGMPGVQKFEFTTKKNLANHGLGLNFVMMTKQTKGDLSVDSDDLPGGVTSTQATASKPTNGQLVLAFQITGANTDGTLANLNNDLSGLTLQLALPKTMFGAHPANSLTFVKYDSTPAAVPSAKPIVSYLASTPTDHLYVVTLTGFSTYLGYSSPTAAGTTTTTTTTSTTASVDTDGDGIIDSLDACPSGLATGTDTDNDGCKNSEDPDDDNDGDLDAADNCPLVANANQADHDGDGVGDVCDTDDDDDGVLDINDSCPKGTKTGTAPHTSGCWAGETATATDTDGDGLIDSVDPCDNSPASGVDTDSDGCKDSEDTDDDNDGVLDASDNCPLAANANQRDIDGDGLGDACDTVDNRTDVDATATQDDGQGNNLPEAETRTETDLPDAGNGPVAIILSIVGLVVVAAIVVAVVVVIRRGNEIEE